MDLANRVDQTQHLQKQDCLPETWATITALTHLEITASSTTPYYFSHFPPHLICFYYLHMLSHISSFNHLPSLYIHSSASVRALSYLTLTTALPLLTTFKPLHTSSSDQFQMCPSASQSCLFLFLFYFYYECFIGHGKTKQLFFKYLLLRLLQTSPSFSSIALHHPISLHHTTTCDHGQSVL